MYQYFIINFFTSIHMHFLLSISRIIEKVMNKFFYFIFYIKQNVYLFDVHPKFYLFIFFNLVLSCETICNILRFNLRYPQQISFIYFLI